MQSQSAQAGNPERPCHGKVEQDGREQQCAIEAALEIGGQESERAADQYIAFMRIPIHEPGGERPWFESAQGPENEGSQKRSEEHHTNQVNDDFCDRFHCGKVDMLSKTGICSIQINAA